MTASLPPDPAREPPTPPAWACRAERQIFGIEIVGIGLLRAALPWVSLLALLCASVALVEGRWEVSVPFATSGLGATYGIVRTHPPGS